MNGNNYCQYCGHLMQGMHSCMQMSQGGFRPQPGSLYYQALQDRDDKIIKLLEKISSDLETIRMRVK